MQMEIAKPSLGEGQVARIRRRTYEVLFESRPGDPLGRVDDVLIPTLILINVLALVLETVEPVYQRAPGVFAWVEGISVAIFSLEYLLRLWSSREAPSGAGRRGFALSPMGFVDLLAVVPFYLPFLGVDLRAVRSLRVLRLLRIGKLARYSVAMQRIGRCFLAARDELVAVGLLIALLVLVSSSLIYFAEVGAQEGKFVSIPDSMWWAVVTATTVGYGDFYPVTALGKMLAGLNACTGVLLFALATGILGSAYGAEIEREKAGGVCPQCGR